MHFTENYQFNFTRLNSLPDEFPVLHHRNNLEWVKMTDKDLCKKTVSVCLMPH